MIAATAMTPVKVLCTAVPAVVSRICSRSRPLVSKRKAACCCSGHGKAGLLLQQNSLSFIVPLSVQLWFCATVKPVSDAQGLLQDKCSCAVKLPWIAGVGLASVHSFVTSSDTGASTTP